MSVDYPRFLTSEPSLDSEDTGFDPIAFQEEMLERVNRDFAIAKQFRDDDMRRRVEHVKQYSNANYYDQMRGLKEFPMPISQMLIDQFVSSVTDKLFFAGSPCKIVGVEDTDKKDADAKRSLMDWQDVQDDIRSKITDGVFDCGLKGRVVAQVDYADIEKAEWVIDPATMAYVKEPVTEFQGAVVKMVDPQDLYFGPDKRDVKDSFPLMIKTSHPRGFFRSKDYFFNFEQIEDNPGGQPRSNDDNLSIDAAEHPEQDTATENLHEYIEWQGLVDEAKISAFMDYRQQQDLASGVLAEEDAVVMLPGEPGNLVWSICGIADGKIVIRLEDEPFNIDKPNIIVGCIEKHSGTVFRAVSLMDKMFPVCRAADRAMGQLIVNIELNVDRISIIDDSAITNKSESLNVNVHGQVITTSKPPGEMFMQIEQYPLTEPLQGLLAYYTQMARDATSLQAITTGQGDPNAETLGEANLVESYAILGLNKYLAVFEETFVQPLYELRNEINQELITEDFRFKVLGEEATNWRTIEAAQVKASINFICESSTRETARAVLIQQLLRFLEIGPTIIAQGFPFRMDELAKMIGEAGLSMSQEQLYTLLPGLKLEEDLGIDVGQLQARSALMQMGITDVMLEQAATAAALGIPIPGAEAGAEGSAGQGSGLESPNSRPLTETDAIQSANAANQVNVRQA